MTLVNIWLHLYCYLHTQLHSKYKTKNNIRNMKVDRKTLKRWKVLVEGGEKTLIAEKCSISKNAVSRAFNGISSPETIEKINNYFKGRK